MSDFLGSLFGVAFFFLCVAAWVTHVLACIAQTAWVLLVIGALFFPIGIIHGIGVWLRLV